MMFKVFEKTVQNFRFSVEGKIFKKNMLCVFLAKEKEECYM